MVEAIARTIFRLIVSGVLALASVIVAGILGFLGGTGDPFSVVWAILLALLVWSSLPIVARLNGTDPETKRQSEEALHHHQQMACDDAIARAIAEYRRSLPATQSCPLCGSVISVVQEKAEIDESRRVVFTTCVCHRSAGKFAFSVADA